MSGNRKDPKGRVLRKGEYYRINDGRYMYQCTDPLGRRKTIYAKTLIDLREKEKKLLSDQLDGLNVYVAGKATLNYVFDRYIASKGSIKPQTKASYLYTYDHFVRKTFGKKLISDICYSDVKFFYNHLLNDVGIQPNTLGNVHTVLHPVFAMAVRDNIIRTNPSDNVIRDIYQSVGKNKGIRHALTFEQQEVFLRYTKENPIYYHWYPLFMVMFGTGCRIGEVIGLRWDDVDLEEKTISINHSAVYCSIDGEKMRFHISTPKTAAGTRTIPMMDLVYEALLMEKEQQEESDIFNTEVVDGMDGFIFCNREGSIHKPSVVNKAIRRIYEAYNAEEEIRAARAHRRPVLIPKFTCHHIRHTFCTRLCEMEANLKAIQDIMGHANIETTLDVYAEASELKKRETMTDLNSLSKQKKQSLEDESDD